MTQPYPLYLAGGLFNAGERLHNSLLEKYFKGLGYKTILPQREADKFFDSETGKFDTKSIQEECVRFCSDTSIILVGCLDGADVDSGTAMEYGVKFGTLGKSVLYRTDFRTDVEKEIGINGMFRENDRTKLIYFPCTAVSQTDMSNYYYRLSGRIHSAVISLWK